VSVSADTNFYPAVVGKLKDGKFIVDFEDMLNAQVFAAEYQKAKDTWFK